MTQARLICVLYAKLAAAYRRVYFLKAFYLRADQTFLKNEFL
jgi:hypothetical protein